MPIPGTRQVDITDIIWDAPVSDPYRWLENNDDPEIKQWVEAQNIHTHFILDRVTARDVIKKRLERLYQINTVGIPVPAGAHYFFEERQADDDLSILYVQEGLNGRPRVLIDANLLSQDKTTILDEWFPSDDGKLVAYGLSESANDQKSIRVIDAETGRNLTDFIPAEVYPCVHSPIAWNPDGSGFWYTRRQPGAPEGEEKFHQKVYYHELGRDYQKDPMIFGETIPKDAVPLMEISKDGRYLLIEVLQVIGQVEGANLYLLDFQDQSRGFVPIVEGIEAQFLAAIHRDTIYILNNHEAPLWKINSISIEAVLNQAATPADWNVVIPESGHRLVTFEIVKDSLFVETLENAHSVFRRYGLDGSLVSEIPLPTLGSLLKISSEDEGDELFFHFVSFLVPGDIYRFDLTTNQLSLHKKIEIGINPDDFEVQQVWYSSKDGTRIPMFLIFKKGFKRRGDNPVLLYGYGGFDVSINPTFIEDAVPFIENGGLYAVANIRGGGEFGENWYQAGVRDKKQNVFDDFSAAANWLINEGYTNSNRLAISGWSNGGLLTATMVTQQPKLFKAAIMGAPVTDMLRYQLFFGGRYWITDYGCVEEADMFQYLLAYSPYHNVKDEIDYPAALIVTAAEDDRVHPMHAYKMTARLQAANISSNPILLLVEDKAGHSSAPAISRLIETRTDMWAFIFEQLKMECNQ